MIHRYVHRSRRGQAIVEFALTAGLFLLLVGGLVQFAVVLWSQNTINQVTRDTARWAVTQSASPCDTPASRAAVAATATQLAGKWSLIGRPTWASASVVDAVGPSGVGADWYPDPAITGITLYPTDCPPSDNRIPWLVRVRVSQAVPIFLPGLQFIASGCGGSFCISSTTELRMEPKRPE